MPAPRMVILLEQLTMAFRILLLLPILTLTQAQIRIKIDADAQRENVAVNFLGEDDDVITGTEISTFGLGDSALKDACRRYHGAWPTDAYLHSPTPWGDLYQSYGWTQVHRKLKPIKATILSIHAEPTIIATQKFRNDASKPAQYTADIKQEVSNTVTDSWTSSHSVTVKQEISFEITVPVGKVGGKTSFSYSHKWGTGESKSEKVTVGAKSGVTVTVQPGDSAIATLTATRGTLEIEVVYEASLYGDVAVNYEGGHNGHYFWRYDVNAVMDAAGIPPTRRITEVLQVGFYADAQIEVNDKYQGS